MAVKNSVMRSDVGPDVIPSEVFQLRDELSNLGEAVTDERLTTSSYHFRCTSRRDVFHIYNILNKKPRVRRA